MDKLTAAAAEEEDEGKEGREEAVEVVVAKG